jgi:hypothetical protein
MTSEHLIPIQERINASGYPLQLHLEELIANTIETHGWRVLVKEHRWVNEETREDGYIDLVLEHAYFQARLCIECKRIIANWNFLLPTTQENYTQEQVRLLKADLSAKKIYWSKHNLVPATWDVKFCVPDVEGKKDSRTIEKIAGELLLSLESLAHEEQRIWRKNRGDVKIPSKNDVMLYIPVIVTTSKLRIYKFNPNDVNIENGQVGANGSVEDVEFIRFCKNLDTNIGYSNTENVGDLWEANRENDRTVFVVTSTKFIDFLSKIARNYSLSHPKK